MTINCVCFHPLLTSQGGGQVIGITNRLWAARSAFCILVGQKTYPKGSDWLWGLFASLFIGHRPGHEFDHSSSSGAEVKNGWSCTSAFLVWLNGLDREHLVLLTSLWSQNLVTTSSVSGLLVQMLKQNRLAFETCSILWDLWWRRNCVEENIRDLCGMNKECR